VGGKVVGAADRLWAQLPSRRNPGGGVAVAAAGAPRATGAPASCGCLGGPRGWSLWGLNILSTMAGGSKPAQSPPETRACACRPVAGHRAAPKGAASPDEDNLAVGRHPRSGALGGGRGRQRSVPRPCCRPPGEGGGAGRWRRFVGLA